MREQLQLNAARRAGVVLSLALASILLAGCHQTGAARSSSAFSAAAASSGSTSGTATSGTADVSWSPPTTNTDGSALTDLAGYRIYYGNSPSALTQSVDIQNVSTTDHVFSGLQQGTWYFAVEAYTNSGLDSSLSQVVSKTIT